MKKSKIVAILHYPHNKTSNQNDFSSTLQSLLNQDYRIDSIVVISDSDTPVSEQNTTIENIKIIKGTNLTFPAILSEIVNKFSSDYYLYLDNQTTSIILKKSAVSAFLMAAQRNDSCGYVYSDYSIDGDREVHLLHHHMGRLRDNQDYGKVHFISHKALISSGFLKAKVKFHALYDLRLRISEKFKLIRIANKKNGSLYTVFEPKSEHNVFDYLLAGKESQLEAEEIVTEHLKRIGAYLAPGFGYKERPDKPAKYLASVIIPVNNRPGFITTAIESVQAQTVRDIECIVVVNGGENDPTCEAVRKYLQDGEKYNPQFPDVRLEIIDINNIGMSLNRGVEIAQGKYYVQLDSDDLLMPEAVERILEVFESDKKVGMVIGSYEVWQKDDDTGEIRRVEEIPVVTHDEWTEKNGRNNLLRINGAGAPRSIPIAIIKEMGYFGINDEPFARNYGEDYDMVLRISEKYRIGRIREPIYKVVRHSGGTDHSIDQATIDRNDEAKDYMRMWALTRRIHFNNTAK